MGKEERDPNGHTHRGKAMRGHSEKIAVCKPGRKASGETKPADILKISFVV